MPTTTRLGLGGALALSLLACKKDPPPEAAVDPRVEKQQACERFAGESAASAPMNELKSRPESCAPISMPMP